MRRHHRRRAPEQPCLLLDRGVLDEHALEATRFEKRPECRLVRDVPAPCSLAAHVETPARHLLHTWRPELAPQELVRLGGWRPQLSRQRWDEEHVGLEVKPRIRGDPPLSRDAE